MGEYFSSAIDSMEKSLEIDQLKKRSDVESKNSEVLDTLSTELHFTCGKADVFRKEMDVLNKEREWLSRIRGSEQGQEFWNDFQILQDQLLSLTKERDELMLRIEEYQTSAFEMELLRRHSDETLFGAKAQVEELSGRISSMETKMQKDEFNNCNEKAKLRMRLRGTQAKLDAFRFRYKELVGELDLMNRKFEAASKKLKDQLASYGIENLNLKKQLASITR